MVLAFAVTILWVLSLAVILAAAVSDFRRRIIPNRWVAVTAGCGVALRLLLDARSIGVSLLIAVAVMLVLGLLAHRQWIGGGDAKLIAAVTMLVPPAEVVELLLWIVIAGGLVSGFYLAAHLLMHKSPKAAPAGESAALAVGRFGSLRAAAARIVVHRTIPYSVAVFAVTASYAVTGAVRWCYATS